MIAANADVHARMHAGAALTDDDVTGLNLLTAEAFNT
jgi:hypothetical protein